MGTGQVKVCLSPTPVSCRWNQDWYVPIWTHGIGSRSVDEALGMLALEAVLGKHGSEVFSTGESLRCARGSGLIPFPFGP